jgi:phosphoribosylaminoimidazole carboxylase (NCAIR synthetase)
MKNKIKKIGIIGSNLTTVLLAEEAKKKGYHTILLEEKRRPLAAPFVDEYYTGSFSAENIERLMLRCDEVVFCMACFPKISSKYEKDCKVYPNGQLRDVIGNRMKQVGLALNLAIPLPPCCYQEGDDAAFNGEEDISIPFTFYQEVDNHLEVMRVITEEDLKALPSRINQDTEQSLLETIHFYNCILSTTVLKKGNQLIFYPMTEEVHEEKSMQRIYSPARITKTMTKNIQRHIKRFLKNIEGDGMMTFKFGMMEDKTIEFIQLNPGVAVGDIATKYHSDISVYEQMMHLLMDLPFQENTTHMPSYVTIVKEEEDVWVPNSPYHFYILDKEGEMPIRVYVHTEKGENLN